MNALKKLVLSTVGSLGYDIVKRPPPATAAGKAEDSGYIWSHIPYDPMRVSLDAYEHLYSAQSLSEKRFYNIGAGSFRHPMWTNVDLSSEWYARDQAGATMIEFDLLSLGTMPIESNTAECVYISHTLEHVTEAAAVNAINEAFRILRPGGILRITGPDVSRELEALRRNDRDHFYYLNLYSHPDVVKKIDLNPDKPFSTASLQQIVLFGAASSTTSFVNSTDCAKIDDAEFDRLFASMDEEAALDKICSLADLDVQRRCPGYHVSWWSAAKAMRLMSKAGFSKVYQSGYGQSVATVMTDTTLFDQQDPKLSFYVEAWK